MFIRTTAAALAALALAAASSAIAQPTHIRLDQEATVGGVGVACTGIGQTKDDLKWQAYPVKVEFAGPGGEYEANTTLMLSNAKGAQLLAVSCEGPWVLLKLPAGKTFKVEGQVGPTAQKTVSGPVKAPSHGQDTVVLRFPAG